MSLLRSWFQQQTTSKSQPTWLPLDESPRTGLLSATDGRTPSRSVRASPSRSASEVHSPPHSAPPRSKDPLLALERYEADIQRQLQSLLDAQSEGLLAGIGQQDADTQSVSDVASSSGTRGASARRAIPVRQPAQSPLSLRAARRGIKSAMRELAAIKEQEADVYGQELASDRQSVGKITAWEERREGLKKEVDEIQSSEGSERAHELEKENQVLQEQITAMENQLMELKGQQNAVNLELSRIENSVQSKLSSYTASLKMLEKEVKGFLAQPPPHPQRTLPEDSPYFTLPAPRRTLEMALGHLQEEKRALEERQQATREEREAIEEGLVVWDDAVAAVTKFEYALRTSIQALGQNSATNGSHSEGHPADINELIEHMDQLVTDLDSKVKLAEARGWKLLVCCIGAELEALRQGRSILDGAQASAEQTQPLQVDEPAEPAQVAARSESPPEGPLRRSTDSFRRRNDRATARPYRPEDDEPDPELLISRQDTDTE